VAETRATAEVKHRRQLVFAALGVLAMGAVLYAIWGTLQAVDYARGIAAGVIATALAICFVFLWHLVETPAELAAIDAADCEATRRELAQLKQTLRPAFRFTVGSTSSASLGQWGQPAMVYLSVENTGTTLAKNVRGRLVAIGPRIVDVPLAWAVPDDIGDPARRSLSGFGAARLNVATSGANPNLLLPTSARPLDFLDMHVSFAREEWLTVTVEISAEGLTPVLGQFRLQWRTFIRGVNTDGVETITPLGFVFVEVEDVLPEGVSPQG
jgi:hypothetical protein